MPTLNIPDCSNMSGVLTMPAEKTRLASSSGAGKTTDPWYARMKQWIGGVPKSTKRNVMRTYVACNDERVPLTRKVICMAALTYVIVRVGIDFFVSPETEGMLFYLSTLGALAYYLTKRMIPRIVWKDAKQAVEAKCGR